MNRNDVLAFAALAALVALAILGRIPGEAVVTFVGGLLLQRPSLPRGEA